MTMFTHIYKLKDKIIFQRATTRHGKFGACLRTKPIPNRQRRKKIIEEDRKKRVCGSVVVLLLVSLVLWLSLSKRKTRFRHAHTCARFSLFRKVCDFSITVDPTQHVYVSRCVFCLVTVKPRPLEHQIVWPITQDDRFLVDVWFYLQFRTFIQPFIDEFNGMDRSFVRSIQHLATGNCSHLFSNIQWCTLSGFLVVVTYFSSLPCCFRFVVHFRAEANERWQQKDRKRER